MMMMMIERADGYWGHLNRTLLSLGTGTHGTCSPWEAKDEQKDPPAESQQKGCSPFAFLPGDFHVHLDEGPRARGE